MKFGRFGQTVGRAAKRGASLFLRYPASLLGVRDLVDRHRFMVDLVRSLRGIRCPSCANGMMVRQQQTNIVSEPDSASEKAVPLFIWRCNHCGHFIYAGGTPKHVSDALQDEAVRNAHERALNISAEDRASDILRWRDYSRLWYGLSGLVFGIGSIWIVWTGSVGVVGFQFWMFGTVYAFFLGIKGAFRCWQARTGPVFVRGAFRRWLMSEAWFV